MIAGGAATAPVPSHANVARSPRPKPQSHWGRTRARRTPGPGTPARAPATRGRTTGGSRATSRSRSDGDVAGRAALGPRARPARAGRERRARDLPRPRAALGQSQDFAYPMYPSRHFHPVRNYQSLVSIVQFIGINVAILLHDAACASTGLTESDQPLPWSRGPIRPGRGERRPMPGSDRGGLVPADSRPGSSPSVHTALGTRARARCGRCSPMSGRTAATTRARGHPGLWGAFGPARASSPRSREAGLSRSPWPRPEPCTQSGRVRNSVFGALADFVRVSTIPGAIGRKQKPRCGATGPTRPKRSFSG